MTNILFVSPADFSDPYVSNGGTYGSRLHLDTLSAMPDVTMTSLSLSRNTSGFQQDIMYIPATKNKWETLFRNCTGYASYLTPKAERIILEYVETGKFDILFLDTSNFGRIARKAKKSYPKVKIVTFFHNVEYVYALSIMHIMGPQYIPTMFCSWYNEKLAIQYSDTLIAINERDKHIIEKKYNTHVSYILPPWYEDYEPPIEIPLLSNPLEVLFLGSYFHANIAGIQWFIEKVLPLSDIRLTIAGKGMEALRHIYHQTDKLHIAGTVKQAKDVYENADCVVAPIFDGSGMKIKTGEALRYGKTIVGTAEAFVGYHITHGVEGYICETSEEFVQAFADITLKQKNKLNIASYTCFQNYLSKQAAIKNYNNILL